MSAAAHGGRMTKITRQFDVGAPPEKVFATISVPERWPQWAGFVKQASSRGSAVHWVYEMAGMKVESDSEVSEVRPNEVYEFRQTGGFLKRAATRLEILPSRKGSAVTWNLEYELPYSYLGKLVDKLKARKQFEEALDVAVANLRGLLER